jgi:hypothetical protein
MMPIMFICEQCYCELDDDRIELATGPNRGVCRTCHQSGAAASTSTRPASSSPAPTEAVDHAAHPVRHDTGRGRQAPPDRWWWPVSTGGCVAMLLAVLSAGVGVHQLRLSPAAGPMAAVFIYAVGVAARLALHGVCAAIRESRR